jgi:hypothetical protein
MNQEYKNFLLNLFYLTLAMGLIGLVFGLFVPAKFYTPALPFMYPFFYSVTAIVFYVVQKATEQRFARFVNYFMISTALKLLLFVLIIFLYALMNKEDSVPFLLTFFVFYLVYSSFEVVYFIKSLNKAKKAK